MYLQLGDLAVLIGSMCAVMATFMGIFVPVLMRTIKSSEEAMCRRFDGLEKAVSRRFDSHEGAVNQRFDSHEKAVNQRFDGLEKAVSRRFDGQDKQLVGMSTHLVEVEKGQGRLSTAIAVVKTDLSYFKPRVERMDSDLRDVVKPGLGRLAGNFSDMADDLGEVKRELKRIAPIERVGADSQ